MRESDRIRRRYLGGRWSNVNDSQLREVKIKKLDEIYDKEHDVSNKIDALMKFCDKYKYGRNIVSVVPIEEVNEFIRKVNNSEAPYESAITELEKARLIGSKTKLLDISDSNCKYVYKDGNENYVHLEHTHIDALIYRLQRCIKNSMGKTIGKRI